MTPAIKYLQRYNIHFELLSYDNSAKTTAFGTQAAAKLNLPTEVVFKTLVVALNTDKLVVALVPVCSSVCLKALAQHMQVKNAKMALPKQVINSSGYVLGGVSPLGQKTRLPTLIDSSALKFENIYVSAGKRGLELKLSPSVLQQSLDAQFVKIAKTL